MSVRRTSQGIAIVGSVLGAVLALGGFASASYPGRNGLVVFASDRAENLYAEIYVIRADGSRRRTLTRHPGFDNDPVPSPDGTRVLFRSSRDNFDSIHVVDVRTGASRSLVSGEQPAWSPDGERIALTSGPRLASVKADGTDFRWLTESHAALPAWSPDGRWIAYFAFAHAGPFPEAELRVVAADGSVTRSLAPGLAPAGAVAYRPTWAPDSSAVAFAAAPRRPGVGLGDESLIYVAPVDGGTATAVSSGPADSQPAWSPDGSRIVFVRARGPDRTELVATAPDGGRTQSLTAGEEGFFDAPAWSSDGSRVAFAGGRAESATSDAFVVDGEGRRSPRRVTREDAKARFPAYEGPRWLDADTLVYATWRPDNDLDLFSVRTDGAGLRRLTENDVDDIDPAWSPDGRRIAFARRLATRDERGFVRSLNSEIYVMRADGTGVRRLTRRPRDDTWPSWSPDGSRIVFMGHGGRNHGRALYVMRVDGSELRRLRRAGPNWTEPAWSPDGRSVAVVNRTAEAYGAELLLVDTARARTRSVLALADEHLSGPAWSPAANRLAFVRLTPCGGSCEIATVDVVSASGRRRRPVFQDARDVAWSPRGDDLVIASQEGIAIGRAAGGVARSVVGGDGASYDDPDWQARCTATGRARGEPLRGGREADTICGLGGDDTIAGGTGRDRLFGHEGNDRIVARDGRFDVIGCGPGRDVVVADRRDLVGADCEQIDRS